MMDEEPANNDEAVDSCLLKYPCSLKHRRSFYKGAAIDCFINDGKRQHAFSYTHVKMFPRWLKV